MIRAFERASKAAELDREIGSPIQVIRLNARLDLEDAGRFAQMIEEAGEFASSRTRLDSGVRLAWSSVMIPMVNESLSGDLGSKRGPALKRRSE